MTTSQTVAAERERLLSAYHRVRSATLTLCEDLEPEDMVVQTMPDVSPTKWHLAHVTWFFETFILVRLQPTYRRFDERYHELFNSYYKTIGEPFPRAERGLLSRPTVAEVRDYRRHVDDAMKDLLAEAGEHLLQQMSSTVTVGLHHEQQHQELLLTDIKNVLARNPLRPVYATRRHNPPAPIAPLGWRAFDGGEVEIGFAGEEFAFDNESPRHLALVQPFELATRAVTVGEYLAFMADGGYQRPELWLADGWDLIQREGWGAPLYWEQQADGWSAMTLPGFRPVDPSEPVCHISYFEADAYARWAGCRLPTEFEWERAAQDVVVAGNLLESASFHPRSAVEHVDGSVQQLFGDVWEWTASPYAAYPGYRPFAGALGEYNGKFMVNQMVLRGGCCVTPADHIRRTYRNFYYPHQRWMFAGLRLAR